VSGVSVSIRWQRLDTTGDDACRLEPIAGGGWRLAGAATFVEDGTPCALRYTVACDAAWRTGSAHVIGTIGGRDVELAIARAPDGTWTRDGVEQPQLAGLVDVDLGFTPATNLVAIRRLALAVGAASPAPAAYLVFPELRLERIEQSYRRLDESRYHYTSPAYDYDEVLVVSPDGFVTDYPRLWIAR
jgi:uncharacterized protein